MTREDCMRPWSRSYVHLLISPKLDPSHANMFQPCFAEGLDGDSSHRLLDLDLHLLQGPKNGGQHAIYREEALSDHKLTKMVVL